MSNPVRNLEPKAIWNNFEDLNSVPRPSKKEERVIAFIKKFGEDLGLPVHVDPTGNVIITKPASAGMEDKKTVILQSHLDMVCVKNNDTEFDFNTQGIESYVDGDWVTANGTTLGADNGMGVATIMSLLQSTDIAHPALEALFTIDEETGMTGAFGLEQNVLKGEILLNLDTEDDDELSIGCAGGVDTNLSMKYTEVAPKSGSKGYELIIKGLKGGHSGMDINLGRGNSNKLLNRIIVHLNRDLGVELASFDGGSLRNAIPREAHAVIASTQDISSSFQQIVEVIKAEFKTTEPNLDITFKEVETPSKVMEADTQTKLTNAILAAHNGVYRMSADIEDLVETSSSLARVIIKDGEFKAQSLQRSSVESAKWDVAYTFAAPFHLIGANVEHTGSYPGWTPNPNSEMLTLMDNLYSEMFSEKANVLACHAGLECGILGSRYPEQFDMISFGPTIKNPHSPDEKVNIESVQKFWNYLQETLKRIPTKN